MNPLSDKIKVGTLGELLVQARLLQFGGQAAPPIKDSGNDLIAVQRECFRAVQVKTRTTRPEESFTLGELPAQYHVMALVRLVGTDNEVWLDQSEVFLVPRGVVESNSIRRFTDVSEFALSARLIEQLFS